MSGVYRLNRTANSVGRINTRRVADASWWLSGGISPANCIAAYQAKGAADIATSRINLVNNATYKLGVPILATIPGFSSAAGWICTGSHGLGTGIGAIDAVSVIIRFSNLVTSTGYICGGGGMYIQPYRSASSHRFNRGGFLIPDGAVLSGVMAIAVQKAFKDGTKTGDIGGGTVSNNPINIGCNAYASGGQANNFITANIQAIALYSIDIETYIPALTTAMNAL